MSIENGAREAIHKSRYVISILLQTAKESNLLFEDLIRWLDPHDDQITEAMYELPLSIQQDVFVWMKHRRFQKEHPHA